MKLPFKLKNCSINFSDIISYDEDAIIIHKNIYKNAISYVCMKGVISWALAKSDRVKI